MQEQGAASTLLSLMMKADGTLKQLFHMENKLLGKERALVVEHKLLSSSRDMNKITSFSFKAFKKMAPIPEIHSGFKLGGDQTYESARSTDGATDAIPTKPRIIVISKARRRSAHNRLRKFKLHALKHILNKRKMKPSIVLLRQLHQKCTNAKTKDFPRFFVWICSLCYGR